MFNLDLNSILKEGSIIDNQRTQGTFKVTLRDVLRLISKDSNGLKCAVGYFYIEGLSLIIESMHGLKEIKILMGLQTTSYTKQELIKAFKEGLESAEVNEENVSAIALFHSLVKEAKTLQVKIYCGEYNSHERLHSKAYLFLRDTQTDNILNRYVAGLVGSSNLTPSGLVANTELNVILQNRGDLHYLEQWFDHLWEVSSDDFDKLKVTEAISQAIQESKFAEKIEDKFVYVQPREFFVKLIRYMNSDYLFEDWKESRLVGFQQLDALRCLMFFSEKNYRGIFLTSSVGLGKSYVACQVAKYFLNQNGKILLIAPSGLVQNPEQWPRYLREFKLLGKVDLLPMGMLQKEPALFEQVDLEQYTKDYSLIIIDEAHNYRNEDAYRTRNLKIIIDKNGNSKILFLTATPINTSPDDLLNLVKLFYRKNANLYFDKLYRNLNDIILLIMAKPYDQLTKKDKEKIAEVQELIEKELFVKSTRTTIKSSPEYLEQVKLFSGVDISHIPDPDVEEITYSLDEKYKDIVNGIVQFISSLTAANLRIIDPEKGARLSGFFKWVLYKRFESDITSYYLTLARIYKKNKLILRAVERKDVNCLLNYEDSEDEYDDVEVSFDLQFRNRISEVIDKIKTGKGRTQLEVLKDLIGDTALIENELKELRQLLLPKNELLFLDDKKLSRLLDCIRSHYPKKILIFTEYKDTLRAIKEFFSNRFGEGSIAFTESKTLNKTEIIERFNKGENLKILVTTDTLSEGYNISAADVVINFDIPYNPVRLIQRIGRATRLDNPKPIKVLNFRPTEDIDRELDLVDRLQLRIEDIIRFVGVEYRIWFQREAVLIRERRKKDVKIYQEILKLIRHDLWKGKFENLEVTVPYTRPILSLMQHAIMRYNITRLDVDAEKRLFANTYTVLQDNKRGLSIFYDDAKVYNESIITGNFKEGRKMINFELTFASEINNFKKALEKEEQEEIVLSYYNDKTDKAIRGINDIIFINGYDQIYPSAKKLSETLSQIKDRCGARTEKIIRDLLRDIRGDLSEKVFRNYIQLLNASFTEKVIQKKLTVKKKPYLALALSSDS